MFDFKIWLDGLAVIAVFAAAGWLLSLLFAVIILVQSIPALFYLWGC